MALALLLIDMQRGAFDGARCPVIDAADTLLANASQLLVAARVSVQVPPPLIVFIQHCETTAGKVFEQGSVHWQLHEDLQPRAGRVSERLIEKHDCDAFENTSLDQQLRAYGAARLVLCGLQSELCVSSTARAALALGYQVLLASDAHSTWNWGGRRATELRAEVNDQLALAGAEVVPSALLASELASR